MKIFNLQEFKDLEIKSVSVDIFDIYNLLIKRDKATGDLLEVSMNGDGEINFQDCSITFKWCARRTDVGRIVRDTISKPYLCGMTVALDEHEWMGLEDFEQKLVEVLENKLINTDLDDLVNYAVMRQAFFR